MLALENLVYAMSSSEISDLELFSFLITTVSFKVYFWILYFVT